MWFAFIHAWGRVLRGLGLDPQALWTNIVAGLIVAGIFAVGGILIARAAHSLSTTSPPSGVSKPTPPPGKRALARQLTSTQLNAILVPKSAYQKLPGTDGIVQADSDSYALQGGLPSLKLCNAPIQIPGIGADSSSSYESVTVLPGNIYFGSHAASFAGQGARQLLPEAASEGPTCGWRSLPGPGLDDQSVRLTTDQEGPEGATLHDDVILVRSGAAVLEVGTAVFSGSHSSDAEMLAEGAAKRPAHAEHRPAT
jgi:hypothetical protein